MVSNGLEDMAKHGKCRICQRVRDVGKYLKCGRSSAWICYRAYLGMF